MVCQTRPQFFPASWYADTSQAAAARRVPVNALLGDSGFIDAFGRSPCSDDSDDLRIRAHLRYVSGRLRLPSAKLQDEQALRRRHTLLGVLDEYAELSPLPENDCSATRTPVFIDRSGNACAVAHLVQVSGHIKLAEAVDINFHCTNILDVIAEASNVNAGSSQVASQLVEWAVHHGFTAEELAWIQPGYGPGAQCIFTFAVLGVPITAALIGLSCLVLGIWAALGCSGVEASVSDEHCNAIAACLGMPLSVLVMLAAFGMVEMGERRNWRCMKQCTEILGPFTGISVVAFAIMFFVVTPWMWAISGPPVWVQIFAALAFLGPTVCICWLCFIPCQSDRNVGKPQVGQGTRRRLSIGNIDKEGKPKATEGEEEDETSAEGGRSAEQVGNIVENSVEAGLEADHHSTPLQEA